jgi:hypothetical protein
MHIPDAVRTLERDLREIFLERLRSLAVYSDASGDGRTATMVVVDRLTSDDLRACAARVPSWHDADLATPLILPSQEFGRALDAFPIEFGAIVSDHVLVSGSDCFQGLTVDPGHLRHACEVQARSHLLHLREAFLETRGRGDALADLICRSAAPLAALLKSVARLHGNDRETPEGAAAVVERAAGLPEGSLAKVTALSGRGQLPSEEARRIFPEYLEAVERLTAYIDRWARA